MFASQLLFGILYTKAIDDNIIGTGVPTVTTTAQYPTTTASFRATAAYNVNGNY